MWSDWLLPGYKYFIILYSQHSKQITTKQLFLCNTQVSFRFSTGFHYRQTELTPNNYWLNLKDPAEPVSISSVCWGSVSATTLTCTTTPNDGPNKLSYNHLINLCLRSVGGHFELCRLLKLISCRCTLIDYFLRVCVKCVQWFMT